MHGELWSCGSLSSNYCCLVIGPGGLETLGPAFSLGIVLTGLVSHRSCAHNFSFCGIKSAMVMPWSTDDIWSHFTPSFSSSILSVSSSAIFPELWMMSYRSLIYAIAFHNSPLFLALWPAMGLCSYHSSLHKCFSLKSQWRQWSTLYKHNYLGSNVMATTCPCSEMIVVVTCSALPAPCFFVSFWAFLDLFIFISPYYVLPASLLSAHSFLSLW